MTEIELLKRIILKEAETETLPQGFDDDPMGFILKKYPGLNNVMEYMMTKDFREFVDAIFVVAPKPTTFKVLLHNGQYFFLQFMGDTYQATVLGKNYYLKSIGEKERCMLAIARLLRYGTPLKTKGPEGGETGTEGGESTAGGEEETNAFVGGEESGGEEGGGEDLTEALEEGKLLESILKKSLTESRGIMYRKTGDEYSDGTTTLEFQKSRAYPEKAEAYRSAEARDAKIAQLEQQFGAKIQFVNNPSNGLLAFAVVELKDPRQRSVYWGKYSRNSTSITWQNDETPEKGRFKPQLKTYAKAEIGINPKQLIGTDEKFLSITQVVNQVTANMNLSDKALQQELIQGLQDIKSGKLPVFKGQANYIAAIQDNFGEIMAPLALMKGLVGGQADEAEKVLLKKYDPSYTWGSCKVAWGVTMTEKLTDSKLYAPNDMEIGISSKGKAGAPASARNLWPIVQRSTPKQQKKFAKAVQVLQIVNDNSAVEQIFLLAPLVGLRIPKALQTEIEGYILSKKPNFSRISPSAKKLIAMGEKEGKTVETGGSGFNAGRALLSILAKLVANRINQDETIDFSNAVKFFMNNASFIQVNCYMSKDGNDAVVDSFEAIYPPTVAGDVSLFADKNYTSGETKGTMSVKFH